MRKLTNLFSICMITLFVSISSIASELTKVGIIGSLMQGLYQGNITIKDAKKLGNFGLGCGVGLGELIVLDDVFYLADENGSISILKDSDMIPFAAITEFKPEITFKVKNISSLAELEKMINSKLISENIFFAVRITGEFNRIDARSEKIATPPYEPLKQWLEKHQKEFYSENCNATLVIVISPEFVKGIGIPGYHTHYILDDKSKGGHVLDVNIKNANIEIMPIYDMKIILPKYSKFLKAKLEYTNETHADLKQVEKGS